MLSPFHIEIMQLALGGIFSPRALELMIRANLRQDRPLAQIGHDEYHFDNNAFEKSCAYIEEQRGLTISSLMANDAPSAWAAFGRLTHTAQDFYAHSNYIDLWLARQPENRAPQEVEPMLPELIDAPTLRSGKVYWLEILTLIVPLRPLIMPLLPRDAHGWMNLDSPERGPNFKFAFQAAVKRTMFEFEKTTKDLPQDLLALFVDRFPFHPATIKLEAGGVLISRLAGRTRLYQFNPRYPFLNELKQLLEKAFSFYPEDVREKLFMNRRRPRKRDKPL